MDANPTSRPLIGNNPFPWAGLRFCPLQRGSVVDSKCLFLGSGTDLRLSIALPSKHPMLVGPNGLNHELTTLKLIFSDQVSTNKILHQSTFDVISDSPGTFINLRSTVIRSVSALVIFCRLG